MAPTQEMPLETKQGIIKLLEEHKYTGNVVKDVGYSQSAVAKMWTRNMGRLFKLTVLVDQGRQPNIKTENLRKYVLTL